jgi:tripartite-type tricarboxylate transporter receptor subunit TctC
MKSSNLFFAITLFLAAQICTAAYPDRPVRLVVPVAPGGAVDVVGRMTAQKLGAYLGQNVVVDNRPGANYIIGTEVVSRAPSDGYTLLTTAGGHTINPVVYKKLPYDTFRDFTPISHIANSSGLVIVVHPSVQINTLQQLIDFAKANPGKMIYVSAGWGNSTHIAGEQFQAMTGVKLTHVPYRSAGPAISDLIGGQVPMMFGPSPVVVPLVQAGRLRPLAFTGLKRSPQLPNVPTVDESGVKGYESTGWYGLYGPRGMPRPIVDKLNAGVRNMVQSKDVLERFTALNLEPVGSTPEEFAKFLKEDYERYVAVAKAANIQPQ